MVSQDKKKALQSQQDRKYSDPRWVAFQILSQLEKKRSNSSQLLRDFLVRVRDGRDRHLVTDLVLGVLRWKGRIEFLLSCFSRRPPEKIDSEVRVLLLLGVYQIVYTAIPHHAAIYETVKLCKKLKLASAASFVNGILRGVQGKLSALPQMRSGDLAADLAAEWSHPEWMVRRWLKRFGESDTKALLETNNTVPPLYLHVNRLVTSPQTVKERLQEEGVETEGTEFGEGVLQVAGGVPQHTASFTDGLFYVQDAAMAALADFISAAPGSRVLEMASAPGGKTFQLAQQMGNQGMIVSIDSSRNRMSKWKLNVERLQIHCAHPVVCDAVSPGIGGRFDQVVIDAPCSSLGVIRRHPEIRWWREEKELAGFRDLQSRMLDTCSTFVRKGGYLVYSVCSFEQEETEEVLRSFLLKNRNFELQGSRNLFPHKDRTDGFFMARLKLA